MTVRTEQGPRNHIAAVINVLLFWIVLAGALTGCQSSNRGVTGTVGTGTGVALSTTNNISSLLPGQTVVITASVTNDVGGAGVVWLLSQDAEQASSAGTLTNITPTSVTFVATTNTTFKGLSAATITATSKANSSYHASVTIYTSGQMVFNTPQFFPGIVDVAYSASLSVSGGTSPYTWTLASGSAALPPGLVLNGSSSTLDAIAGTPTTAGTYSNIIVQVVDSSSPAVTVTQNVTLTINAAQSCIVTGDFALMVTGFRGGGQMNHVANINIDATGKITGEQDYKDGHRTTVAEQLQSTSACTNRQTNSGQINLVSASGSLLYNFSVTPPDANDVSQSARVQLIGSGDDSASGLMQRIDPSIINTSSPPIGNFAFGMLGAEAQEPNTLRYAVAGRFTTADASGAMTSGLVDSNLDSGLTAATLNGTLGAPDAFGRGLATFHYAEATSNFVYYVVNGSKMYLMNIDAQSVGNSVPRLAGYMTAQVPTAGTVFDNSAFSTPGVLSLWGGYTGLDPITTQTMGLLSGGAATPGTGGGTLNAILDITSRDNDYLAQNYTGQSFSVDGSGRGTIDLTDNTFPYNLTVYLDGASNGYVVQQGAPGGGPGGLLEAQTPMSIYPVTFNGYFVGGTQFPQSAGPITLTPLVSISYGSLSSNFTNGSFAIDQTSGRGFGSITRSGVGQQPAVLYFVSPTKLEVMSFGTRAIDGGIDWLVQNVD